MIAVSGSARLAYDVVGSGPDVLFVHAGVTDRRSWASLVDRLCDRFRCITYDMRGFGETEVADDAPYSAAADARAVLDAAGSSRAAVVGCSFGGRVTLDLAVESCDRVAALVLINAGVTGGPEDPDVGADIAELYPLIKAAEDAGDVDELNRLEAWLWLDGPTAPEHRVGGAVRELFLDMNGVSLRRGYEGRAHGDADAWSHLPELAVPSLVVVGELDALESQTVNEGIAERIPGARVFRMPGVAHLPHLEEDPATLDTIVAFLDESYREPGLDER